MDWLFRNRPVGDEYHSWWGGNTRVEVLLSEGQKVGRIREYSQNKKGEQIKGDDYYYIDDQEFRAFGNGPPPQPVLNLLNLSDVNFQAQSDPSFLISNSSGEVARYLNKAAHLDVIDQAISNILGILKDEKGDLKKEKEILEADQFRLMSYVWLEEADKQLVGLETLQDSVISWQREKEGLSLIARDYERVQTEKEGLEKILSFSDDITGLLSLHDRIEKGNIEWEALAGIIDQYEGAEKELALILPMERMGIEVDGLVVLAGRIRDERGRYDSLDQIVELYEETEKTLSSYSWLPGIKKSVIDLEMLDYEIQGKRQGRKDFSDLVCSIERAEVSLSQAGKEQERLMKLMPKMICPLCEGKGRVGE